MIQIVGRFFFDTVAGRAVAIAAGALVMFSAWLWRHDTRVAEQARSEFVTQTNKETEKARAKAVQARKPADEPGAAGRLLNSSCRDC